MIANGYDLTALGFVLDNDSDEWLSTPDAALPSGAVPEGLPSPLAGRPSVEPRRITITGRVKAASRAALRANLDGIKRRLQRDQATTIRLPDQADRHLVGFVERITVAPIAPVYASRAARIRISLYSRNPYWQDVTAQTVALTTGGASLPVGTGPCWPRVEITGATDPILVLRTNSGVEVGRMELTGTGTFHLDMATYQITDGGTATRAAALTAGDFFPIRPEHASEDGTGLPTLALSSGTGNAIYRRAWS